MEVSPGTVDALLCAALRGEEPAWPWGEDEDAVSQVLDRAGFHGVAALLHAQALAGWPAQLRQVLRDQSVQRTMWELRHQHLLIQALDHLNGSGIEPILIKGTALAYSLYANPALRIRGDTDLVIPAEAKERTDRALQSIGWQRALGVSGEFVSFQANYTQQFANGAVHTLDLHWKVSNSPVLAKLFSYEELRLSARALPALSKRALAPEPVLALLVACMHRATHLTNPYYVDGTAHSTDNRLIWLADIHLLAQRFNVEEWRLLARLADQKGLHACTAAGLRAAYECFGGGAPAALQDWLSRTVPTEAPATYLQAGKLMQQWLDFRAVGGVSARWRLLREAFFPSPEYMRAKYGARPGPLSWLYLRRMVSGVAKSIHAARTR